MMDCDYVKIGLFVGLLFNLTVLIAMNAKLLHYEDILKELVRTLPQVCHRYAIPRADRKLCSLEHEGHFGDKEVLCLL